MKKRPLAERIDNWIFMHQTSGSKHIPIHVDDVDDALKKHMYARYELPYRVLGTGAVFGGAPVDS